MANRSRHVLLYEETLSVFEDTTEPLTTMEVADALGLDRRAVYERLANLADDDRLETKKVGASGRIWWLPDRDVANRDPSRNELAHSQESVTVLNNLHEVVVEITEAVLDRQTRHEIESTVCELLASSDSYAGVCIAEVDPDRNELDTRVRAGIKHSDGDAIPIDADSPRGRTPASRAARTGSLQVSQDFYTETPVDAWREAAENHGLCSCAAIPIVHESTLYGLLCLSSERGDAFGTDERAVLDQLGSIVGHAIATADRNRAMMSDEIIEVGLISREYSESKGIDSLNDGIVELYRTIPIDDGRYLMYGTACKNGFAGLTQQVESDNISYMESVSVISNDGDRTTFEALVSDAPVTSVVAEHGGYVNDSRYEDGDFFATVHLPPEADVGKLVEEIRSIEPSLEPINRRQKVREQRSFEDVSSVIDEKLTDRQRDTLEAAYFSGFFEWPRDSSGEAVASSLGVSPATFHQHVRTAEKKILKVLLNDE